ncbi:unnamed protein product [marine sediment metagenome]|uniref:Uncharacterized protein n=1 Tax=marine sediment metagenome TaxID=412755 RepID=X0SN50_9ZZZZ
MRDFWWQSNAITQAIIAQKVVNTPGSKMAKSIKLCKMTPKQAQKRAAAMMLDTRYLMLDARIACKGDVRRRKPMIKTATGVTYNVTIT